MKQPAPQATDESLLAVAERRGGALRVLLVRRGERPSVLEARTFGPSDASTVWSWLEGRRCGDLRVVLPAAATIVRQTMLPAAVPSQMLSALRLQAEGMFLGSVPIHRMGFGLVGEAVDGERQGVIVAWPESQSGVEDPGLALVANPRHERSILYVPEVAAMLLLATGDLPAVSADRRLGSIAIAMRTARGILLRATRESAAAADDAEWSEGLRAAIAETALNAGTDPSRLAQVVAETEAYASVTSDAVSMLGPDLRQTLSAQVEVGLADAESPAWWREWAIPLAAAAIACGPLAELARLRRREEGARSTRFEHVLRRYSDPSRAFKVALVSFALIGLAPIAFAWLRGAVIAWKMPDEPAAFEMQQRRIEQRIAHYQELGKRALPMAKILADVACCTPDGIEIESIQVSQSQGVSIRGVSKGRSDASAYKNINDMVAMMDASGVFAKTQRSWESPRGLGSVKFDIEAPIVRPALLPEYPEERDWGIKTLAQRKFATSTDEAGDGAASATAGEASEVEPAAVADAGAGEAAAGSGSSASLPAEGAVARGNDVERSVPGRGIGRRGGDASEGGDGGASAGSSAPQTAASGAGAGGGPAAAALANARVPDPFSDDQLKTMSRDERRALLAEIAKAKRRSDLDSDTAKRLNDDFQRVLEALRPPS